MTDQNSDQTPVTPDLLNIAQKYFVGLETLETQSSDELDFHDVAVWNLKGALEESYKAGRQSVPPPTEILQRVIDALSDARRYGAGDWSDLEAEIKALQAQ